MSLDEIMGHADLDAIVAGALVAGRAGSLAPFFPELAPRDRERVDGYVARASADATLRAYRSDWRLFCACCAQNGYRSLPAAPATVTLAPISMLDHTGSLFAYIR